MPIDQIAFSHDRHWGEGSPIGRAVFHEFTEAGCTKATPSSTNATKNSTCLPAYALFVMAMYENQKQ